MKFALFLVFSLKSLPSVAEPTNTRLLEIRKVVSSLNHDSLFAGVIFRKNTKIEGPAWSFILLPDQPVIETNPLIFEKMPIQLQTLIMYHEIGHVRLGHLFGFNKAPEVKKENELEADAFAAITFSRYQSSHVPELLEILKTLEQEVHTQPTGPDRLKVFRRHLK